MTDSVLAVTYFSPRTPLPDAALTDQAYAAEHCKQTAPTSVLSCTLADLRAACERATTLGRKGDAGYIIAGDCTTTRKEGGPAGFALIDQDDGEPNWAALDLYEGFAWTTHGHRVDRPAWRIVIPLIEPMAHGKLRCPFRGAHIRNRTQPAFLPTHSGQGVQWRALQGAARLDAAALGGREVQAFEDTAASRLGAAFEAAGWVEREQPGGLVVRCPWVHEHSDGDIGGTVVFHADPDGAGHGKFFCSRTKCAAANGGTGRTSWQAIEVMKGIPAVAAELAHWHLAPLDGWVRGESPAVQVQTDSTDPLQTVAVPSVDAKPPHDMICAAEAWMSWMNSQFTLLTALGGDGKVRVCSWIRDANDPAREVVVLQGKENFLLRMAPITGFIEGKKDKKSGAAERTRIAEWWLQRFDRSEATRLCFRPDLAPGCHVHGQLNLWRGYGIVPASGDWSLLLEHLRLYVARSNPDHLGYIVAWMAWVIQNPGLRAEVVLVFKGSKGSGKNTAFDSLRKMLGQHGKSVSSPKHLTGNFNAHLQDCALLFANEAIPPHDKGAESVLKSLVTDDTIAIERKGVDVEHAPNTLSICMASNEEWCVPATIDERRFAVFEIDPRGVRDAGYWKALHDQLDNGGRAAMLRDLLALNLTGWHPRNGLPKTAALAAQQVRGLRGVEAIVYQMLASGQNLGELPHIINGPIPAQGVFVSTRILAEATSSKEGTMRRLHELAAALSRACDADQKAGTRYLGDISPGQRAQVRGYLLPPLTRARENWADSTDVDVTWADPEEWA